MPNYGQYESAYVAWEHATADVIIDYCLPIMEREAKAKTRVFTRGKPPGNKRWWNWPPGTTRALWHQRKAEDSGGKYGEVVNRSPVVQFQAYAGQIHNHVNATRAAVEILNGMHLEIE